MLVTLTRYILLISTVFFLVLTAFGIFSYQISDEDGEERMKVHKNIIWNYTDELHPSKKIIKSYSTNKANSNLELIQTKITSQERKIEDIRHKVESLRQELTDVGGRSKRSLKTVLSKCPIKSPHLLGSLFVKEVWKLCKVHLQWQDRYPHSFIYICSCLNNIFSWGDQYPGEGRVSTDQGEDWGWRPTQTLGLWG